MTTPQITSFLPSLPESPSRDDPENFDDEAEDMVAVLPAFQQSTNEFGVQANEMAVFMNDRALAAEQSAASAAQAALAAGATTWAAGTYDLNTAKVSPSNQQTYRKRTATSATTIDPADDPTNWKNISSVDPVAAALVDTAGVFAWDAGAVQIPTVTLTGTRSITAPTNLKIGTYIMHIVQDATGNRGFTLDLTVYKFAGNVQPSIGLGANERTVVSMVSDGTKLYCSYQPGF